MHGSPAGGVAPPGRTGSGSGVRGQGPPARTVRACHQRGPQGVAGPAEGPFPSTSSAFFSRPRPSAAHPVLPLPFPAVLTDFPLFAAFVASGAPPPGPGGGGSVVHPAGPFPGRQGRTSLPPPTAGSVATASAAAGRLRGPAHGTGPCGSPGGRSCRVPPPPAAGPAAPARHFLLLLQQRRSRDGAAGAGGGPSDPGPTSVGPPGPAVRLQQCSQQCSQQ
mmetsp:Transcript_33278/g.48152  ORF Transcript_33278/g.48152 Transcript_33278/m.48152 type:complete len:220 (-) Transcript_33278:1906-2565(-)